MTTPTPPPTGPAASPPRPRASKWPLALAVLTVLTLAIVAVIAWRIAVETAANRPTAEPPPANPLPADTEPERQATPPRTGPLAADAPPNFGVPLVRPLEPLHFAADISRGSARAVEPPLAEDRRNAEAPRNPREPSRPPPRRRGPTIESPFDHTEAIAALGRSERIAACDSPFKQRGTVGRGPNRAGDNIVEALFWLRDHQSEDGHWSADAFAEVGRSHGRANGTYGNSDGSEDTGWPRASVGVTGLALLAFLGAGYTHRDNEFAGTVRLALRYLKNAQDNDGCFGPKTDYQFTYGHAICTMAMAEAYGLTGAPMLRGPAQKGADFIALAQNEDPDAGWLGWRYSVKSGDNDTSVTGWMVLALVTVKAAGLLVEDRCFEGAMRWLDLMTADVVGALKTGYDVRGGYHHHRPLPEGFEDRPTMSAVNIVARWVMGANARDPSLLDQARQLSTERFLPTYADEPRRDFYYWFFGSLAMFHMGGSYWDAWEAPMIAAVTGSHRMEGDRSYATYGSWDPVDTWGPAGGRVYATAINCLTLETPVRYEWLGE